MMRVLVVPEILPSSLSRRRTQLAATGCCESLRMLLGACAPPGLSRRTQRVESWIPPGRARRRSVRMERFLSSCQLWAPPGQAGRKPTPAMGAIRRRPFSVGSQGVGVFRESGFGVKSGSGDAGATVSVKAGSGDPGPTLGDPGPTWQTPI